jgi:acetyl-CoA carboxylase carboxyl transferase subunit alpha
MLRLRVPVICVIIGEGASGGALGIGVGDRVLMMENTWYSVISPESCSSILWRSWDKKELAAEQLKLTAEDMLKFGLIDGIIPEPVGGAHWDYNDAAEILKNYLIPVLSELKNINPEDRINQRIHKFGRMGFWEEVDTSTETGLNKENTTDTFIENIAEVDINQTSPADDFSVNNNNIESAEHDVQDKVDLNHKS